MAHAGQTGRSLGGDAALRPVGRRREDYVVGTSRATRLAVEQATAAAGSDLPVWILGPLGTGKELLARAVHSWGPRASGPLEVIAAEAIPEALHAREVFGCASGVHTLLPADYQGVLARAAGGTAVIDGVDRLRPDVRLALAEAIRTGSFSREGETARTPLAARVVMTAEVEIEGLLPDGIEHHRIDLPPLAERPEDILPLAAHFLQAFAAEAGVRPAGFTPEARTALLAELWPGNVAELRERIRHAVKIAGGDPISPEALLLACDGQDVPSFKEAKRAFETRYVVGLLRRCGGNISRAARLARKDRKDFYDVIRRTGVNPQEFRG